MVPRSLWSDTGYGVVHMNRIKICVTRSLGGAWLAWAPGLCSAVYDTSQDRAVRRVKAQILLDALCGEEDPVLAFDLEDQEPAHLFVQ